MPFPEVSADLPPIKVVPYMDVGAPYRVSFLPKSFHQNQNLFIFDFGKKAKQILVLILVKIDFGKKAADTRNPGNTCTVRPPPSQSSIIKKCKSYITVASQYNPPRQVRHPASAIPVAMTPCVVSSRTSDTEETAQSAQPPVRGLDCVCVAIYSTGKMTIHTSTSNRWTSSVLSVLYCNDD